MTFPFRVLILNERDPKHPKAGGAEVHVLETFCRLASAGYSVTLASSSFRGAERRDRIEGLEVWRLGPLPTYYPHVAWTCARETRRRRFDVVVECLNKVPFYSAAYSTAPVLALCHHLFGEVAFAQVAWPIAAAVWTAERGIPWLYRRLPFVTISESSRDDLIRRGVPGEHIAVVHCGVATPLAAPVPWSQRARRVSFIGRLEPYKRVDVMLRAMALLSARCPEAEILVIGRGSMQPRLEALAQKLGLAERTRFTGLVDDSKRDHLLAGSRVCVFPSKKEGWGLTVIEANAVGTPVVASDAPGLRDSVRHGETGFLVEDDNVEGFAERICELLEKETLGARMSEAALAWSRKFDWDRAAAEMAELVDRTRQGTPAVARP